MGSRGAIPTDVQPEVLVRCLRQVPTGLRLRADAFQSEQPLTGNEFSTNNCYPNSLLATLTERERQIVSLVSDGSSKERWDS